jgi:serine/threonine-protein kinase HipA
MQRAERRAAEGKVALFILWQRAIICWVSQIPRDWVHWRFRRVGEESFQAPDRAGVPALIQLGKLLQITEHILRDEETDEDLQLIFAPGSSIGGARPEGVGY